MEVNWHDRYRQQAGWTRELRAYLFERVGMKTAERVLEVGCGTGAILCEVETSASLHGLDIQLASLKKEAHVHAPGTILTCGDALCLPYADNLFDITFSHFFLLWVSSPESSLAEMKRVTRPGGHILALAEPDYSARVDEPAELGSLGNWQKQALRDQGANPSLGGSLAEYFYQAGIKLVETGAIQSQGDEALKSTDWEMEWAVLENDLAGIVMQQELQRLKKVESMARADGKRKLHVPTYFAWGQA